MDYNIDEQAGGELYYKAKYFKYKSKYLALKKQQEGGGNNPHLLPGVEEKQEGGGNNQHLLPGVEEMMKKGIADQRAIEKNKQNNIKKQAENEKVAKYIRDEVEKLIYHYIDKIPSSTDTEIKTLINTYTCWLGLFTCNYSNEINNLIKQELKTNEYHLSSVNDIRRMLGYPFEIALNKKPSYINNITELKNYLVIKIKSDMKKNPIYAIRE
jgi:hypothetical protein